MKMDGVIAKINAWNRLTNAICGLDEFTKNWCLNHEETEKQDKMVFRCSECCFREEETRVCLIKKFAKTHDSSFPMELFGYRQVDSHKKPVL